MDRRARGWPRSDGEEPGQAHYGPISEALAQPFAWDAHVAGYSLPSVPHRLAGSGALGKGAHMVLVVFDCDTANHAPITAAWWAEFEPKVRKLIHARGRCYVYSTAHGVRIVYALAEP